MKFVLALNVEVQASNGEVLALNRGITGHEPVLFVVISILH